MHRFTCEIFPHSYLMGKEHLGCEGEGRVMARFSHIAGDPTLDLINTVEWRLSDDDREEDLTGYDDVVAWCLESNLIDPAEARTLHHVASEQKVEEHALVLSLREALYRALFSHDADAERVITAEVHQAVLAADYLPDDGSWHWKDRQLTAATARHRIARAMMSLLGRSDLSLLHQCEDARCGWVFLDTSRAHNRRWCVTKDCGDRNRSRAYYARQKNRD